MFSFQVGLASDFGDVSIKSIQCSDHSLFLIKITCHVVKLLAQTKTRSKLSAALMAIVLDSRPMHLLVLPAASIPS